MNRVILVGRITRDPELRTSPNNVSFTAFSIAVNRTAVSSNGEREADFINCVAFAAIAFHIGRICKNRIVGFGASCLANILAYRS